MVVLILTLHSFDLLLKGQLNDKMNHNKNEFDLKRNEIEKMEDCCLVGCMIFI